MLLLNKLFSIQYLASLVTFYGCGGGGGSSGGGYDPQVGQAAIMNAQIAQDVWANYKKTYLPKEEQWAEEAFNYDTPEKREEAAGLAQADSQQATSNQRNATERSLQSMGVDPTSGKFADTMAKSTTASAVQEAGAANRARKQVEDTAYARKQDVVSIGKGMPGTASTAITNSGNLSAQNASIAAQNQQAQTNNTANAIGGAIGLASAATDWFKDGGEVKGDKDEQHLAMGGVAAPAGPAGLQQIINNGATIRSPVVPQQQQTGATNQVLQAVKTANQVNKIGKAVAPGNVGEALNASAPGRVVRDALGLEDWAVKKQADKMYQNAPNYGDTNQANQEAFDKIQAEGPGAQPAGGDSIMPDGTEVYGDDPITTNMVTDSGAAATETGAAATETGAVATEATTTGAALGEATTTGAALGEAATVGAAATEAAAAAPMAAMGPVGWVGLGALAASQLFKDGGKVKTNKKGEVCAAGGGVIPKLSSFSPGQASMSAMGKDTSDMNTAQQLASIGGDVLGSIGFSDGGEPGLDAVVRKDLRPGGEVHGPGTETSDSVPARLSKGEVVENAKAVDIAGSDFLVGLNELGKQARYGKISDDDAAKKMAAMMIQRAQQMRGNQKGARA